MDILRLINDMPNCSGNQYFREYDNYIDSNDFIKKRMTTFIKTKFKISDDQMKFEKYRLAANITEYHCISKLILQ